MLARGTFSRLLRLALMTLALVAGVSHPTSADSTDQPGTSSDSAGNSPAWFASNGSAPAEQTATSVRAVHPVWEFSQELELTVSGIRPTYEGLTTDGSSVFTILQSTIYSLNINSGELQWERTFSRHFNDLILSTGKVFVADDQAIYALDAATGDERWKAGDTSGYRSGISTDGGALYATTTQGNVVAIDIATGVRRWSTSFDGKRYFLTPVAADGRVVLAGPGLDRGAVVCLDAENGRTIWTLAFGKSILVNPLLADGAVYLGFTSYEEDGVMIPTSGDVLGFQEPGVLALDARTGSTLWGRQIDGYVEAAPSLDGDQLFVASNVPSQTTDNDASATLVALDAADGTLRWEHSTDGPVIQGSPNVQDGVVYFANASRSVSALDVATGDEFWTYRVGSTVLFAPIPAGTVVLTASETGDNGTISALSPGRSSSYLGNYLFIGCILLVGVGGACDLIIRRRGGWQTTRIPDVLAPYLVRFGLLLFIAIGIGYLSYPIAALLAIWVGLIVLAGVKVMTYVNPSARRRHLLGIAVWSLITLALSIDLTNERLGPLKLLDRRVEFVALLLLAALGGFVLSGWMWPAELSLAWISVVSSVLLVFAFQDGESHYLDAWRVLLGDKMQPGFIMSAPTWKRVSLADLIVLALVGAGFVFASGAMAGAVRRTLTKRRTIPLLLLALFFGTTALGVANNANFANVLALMPLVGLLVGGAYPHAESLPIMAIALVTAACGAAGGILLSHDLLFVWETPECDAMVSFCTPSAFAAAVAFTLLATLLATALGIGAGPLLARGKTRIDPKTGHHHV